MTILAYFDASGTEDLQAMSAAGFAASEEQWAAFERDWIALLSNEGIAQFHMKEFAHSVGEFALWKEDETRRQSTIKRIKEIVFKHQLTSVGRVIFVEEYNTVT
jgi:hypothetical protein